jgi:glycosyltransferase involved in cell wall biosynthesis
MQISQKLKDQIYFVIAAYNEERSIGNVLSELLKNNYSHIIVVNDGSKDKTSELVLNYDGVTLLEHVVNRGQGAALKTGIDYALKQDDCKYIVTFDADGQHRLSDLPKFIGALETGKYDIAIGSRFMSKESSKLVPFKKRVLLKGALLVTWFLSGISLTDTHNGYRVMNKTAAKQIDMTMDGFEHASEIIDEIAKKRVKYKEIPVFIDYTEYSKQKGQKMSNSVKIMAKMILKK